MSGGLWNFMETKKEKEISITPSELRKLIEEAVKTNKGNNSSIFSSAKSILKRKQELHLKYPEIKKRIEANATKYWPDPYIHEFFSMNRFSGDLVAYRCGPANPIHEYSRKLALVAQGVSTNRDLQFSEETSAKELYDKIVDLVFEYYEAHLDQITSQKIGG